MQIRQLLKSIICLAVFCISTLQSTNLLAQKTNNGLDGFSLSYTNPKKYEIGGITVSGVKFLDPNALIAITGLRVGDEVTIPGDKISSAIKKLWDQGILGDVEVNATKIDGRFIFLDFKLRERPRLARFSFKGTKKGETDDIRDKIQLIRGKVVTDALIKNTQNTIKKFYTEKGYMNADVKITQQLDSNNTSTVVLKIEVNRNKKVKVKDIIFEGNESFKEITLRRKMKETKEKRWYRLKSAKFLQNEYESDKQSIIAYYNKEGYRDAEILGDSIYQDEVNTVNIKLDIYEGPKYFFRNITWVGNYLYGDEILQRILNIKRGDVYNKELLDRKLSFNPNGTDLTSLYQDDGYLFSNIEPVEVRIDGDSIDLEMRVYEGPQVTINKVTVTGNTKTNDHVILREVRTRPGDKYARADLIRSVRDIAALGYFDPEGINPTPTPDPVKGTVDINYTVTERPNDQIEMSGGWGGFFGFVGTVGVSFNNFSAKNFFKFNEWNPLPSGDGQRLSIRFQANGRQFQTYSMSFSEPWLGGSKPHSLTLGASHSVQRTLSGESSRLQVSNLNANFGRRLKWPDDYFTLNHTLQYQRYLLENYTFIAGSDFNSGTANNLSLINTVSRSSVNNPIFPSAGSSLTFTLTATPPWSRLRRDNTFETDAERYKLIEFHKWMVDAAWYTGIAKNLVLSTRAHMGFIGQYNSKIGIGPFERFKVGGDGITGFNFLLGYDIIGLRGYANNSIGPNSGIQAGVVYNKFVTELRYAISTAQAATIFVLAFAESGNNWGDYKTYNPFSLYRSVGAGVRFMMPAFGMLGVDYGYGFDRLPGQVQRSGGNFHFTIGQQIR